MTISSDERPPGEAASEWFVRLQNADAKVRLEFFAWLRQSPRHVEEFLLVTATWQALQEFGRNRPATVGEMLVDAAATADEQANIVPLRPPAPVISPIMARRRPFSPARILATGLAVVAFVVAITVMLGSDATYATGKGEQRLIRLEDGSIVHLNTDSVLTVSFSATARDIKLRSGEALFSVHPDPSRPFRVQSGGTVIQAIGTQFNVYRRSSGTRVSVLEGIVRISADATPTVPLIGYRADGPARVGALMVSAGEQVDSTPTGQLVREVKPDLAQAMAWQDRRLIFDSERLETAVAEVNRYSSRRIRVEGALNEMRLSAIFDASDPESLVRFLQGMEGVVVETRRREVVIRSAEPRQLDAESSPR